MAAAVVTGVVEQLPQWARPAPPWADCLPRTPAARRAAQRARPVSLASRSALRARRHRPRPPALPPAQVEPPAACAAPWVLVGPAAVPPGCGSRSAPRECPQSPAASPTSLPRIGAAAIPAARDLAEAGRPLPPPRQTSAAPHRSTRHAGPGAAAEAWAASQLRPRPPNRLRRSRHARVASGQ